ncbi:trypsin-like peptidase domain-containing protein [Roseburia hominis]
MSEEREVEKRLEEERPRTRSEEEAAEKARENGNTLGEAERYSFLKETVKDEQVTGKSVLGLVLKTAGRGAIFGLAACIVFSALRPWAERTFGESPQKVTIPADEEEQEKPQEGNEEEEQEAEPVIPVLTADNYQEMYEALYQIADTASDCVVEVSAVKDENAWEGTHYDAVNSVSGIIVWENVSEILVLAPSRILQDAKSLTVTFTDNAKYSAVLKKQDRNLGLAVFAVDGHQVSDNTKNQTKAAVLGNSNIVNRGDPVICLGKMFGYAGGTGYGIISSVRNRMTITDGDFRILCTDVAMSEGGSGVLFNLKGEVIGLADQKITDGSGKSMVTAFSISGIKEVIEKLSNGQAIPYLGINGVEVTESISQDQEVPKGIYVKDAEADSPAMKAGIQSGDVITQVGKTKVSTISGYRAALMEAQVGEELRLRGQRQGASGYVDVNFTVTVGSLE